MELNQRLFVTVEEFKWSPFDRVLCALRRYRDPCQNMVVSHTMVYYYTCPWVLVQPLVKTVFLLTCSTEMRRLFMYNKAEMLAILYYDMLLPELLSPASLCKDTSGLQLVRCALICLCSVSYRSRMSQMEKDGAACCLGSWEKLVQLVQRMALSQFLWRWRAGCYIQ